MPGKGRITLTGQLGEVMKESSTIAYSYVMARLAELGVDGIYTDSLVGCGVDGAALSP